MTEKSDQRLFIIGHQSSYFVKFIQIAFKTKKHVNLFKTGSFGYVLGLLADSSQRLAFLTSFSRKSPHERRVEDF